MRERHIAGKDFFSGMPEAKQQFACKANRLRLDKNAILFFEGDPGGSCYYLESGLTRIFSLTASGKEPIFFIRRPGEMFGLSEVLDSSPRKANAQTLSPCVLLQVRSREFDELLRAHYAMNRRVISLLGSRIRYLGERISSLMTCSVRERLVKLLVYVAYDTLEDSDAWTRPATLPVPLTQQQMASMTGSTQPTVSELLGQLQQEGLITVSRKRIVLHNPLALLSSVEIAPYPKG